MGHHIISIRARCAQDGRTPIFVAAAKGRLDVVVCLAKHGADVNLAITVRAGAFCLCLLCARPVFYVETRDAMYSMRPWRYCVIASPDTCCLTCSVCPHVLPREPSRQSRPERDAFRMAGHRSSLPPRTVISTLWSALSSMALMSTGLQGCVSALFAGICDATYHMLRVRRRQDVARHCPSDVIRAPACTPA